MSRRLEERMKNIESRMKRIEDELQFSKSVTSFNWKEFSERDRSILRILLQKERCGASTTELAELLDMKEPETSGRVKTYRSLRRIERISRKLKGWPIVAYDKKRWSLNYDDWQFNIDPKEIE